MPIERRLLARIRSKLFQGKMIVLYGARRVGKTTLCKKLLEEFGAQGRYLNCEILSVKEGLSEAEPAKLASFLGDAKVVVLDEAQTLPHAGAILKLLADELPQTQFIATGSSAFALAQGTGEPLTGRALRLTMTPVTAREAFSSGAQATAGLEARLRFGWYPEVIGLPDADAAERLEEIASNYLFRDVLGYEGIKKAPAISRMCQLLALQIGQEVSFSELGTQLGMAHSTVQKYVEILEQSHVLFVLRPFSRNPRKELSKSPKIYFWDLGIRNALIRNFNPPALRADVGALWENFCLAERRKARLLIGTEPNRYFWRTRQQKEVDLVEEDAGALAGFEFKWSPKGSAGPGAAEFAQEYGANVSVVTRKDWWEWVK